MERVVTEDVEPGGGSSVERVVTEGVEPGGGYRHQWREW